MIFNDTHVRSFSLDNLKELNKNINEKIYSLLNKVNHSNISSPIYFTFIVDYSTMEIGIIMSHTKVDNRLKDIPKEIRKSYDYNIPEEDYNYFYGDSKASSVSYTKLILSPNFIYSTVDIDIYKSISTVVINDGFLIFPRSLYTYMKSNNKMLFKYIKFDIIDNKLEIDYKIEGPGITLLKYNSDIDRLFKSKPLYLENSNYNDEIKELFKKFSKEKIIYKVEDKKIFSDISKLELPTNINNETIEIFKSYVVGGIPKFIEYTQTDVSYNRNIDKDSEKIFLALINLNYGSWNAYYFYYYIKILLGDNK